MSTEKGDHQWDDDLYSAKPSPTLRKKRRYRARLAAKRAKIEPAPVTPEYLASLIVTEEDWARLACDKEQGAG